MGVVRLKLPPLSVSADVLGLRPRRRSRKARRRANKPATPAHECRLDDSRLVTVTGVGGVGGVAKCDSRQLRAREGQGRRARTGAAERVRTAPDPRHESGTAAHRRRGDVPASVADPEGTRDRDTALRPARASGRSRVRAEPGPLSAKLSPRGSAPVEDPRKRGGVASKIKRPRALLADVRAKNWTRSASRRPRSRRTDRGPPMLSGASNVISAYLRPLPWTNVSAIAASGVAARYSTYRSALSIRLPRRPERTEL